MRRVDPQSVERERQSGSVCILDVRSEKAYATATEHIPGDIRRSPDQIESWWTELPKHMHIVTYCT